MHGRRAAHSPTCLSLLCHGAVHVCKLTSSPSGSIGRGSQTITEAHYLKLLNEFVTVCDPVSDSCPDKNKQTFQLTVDQVCAARNTTIKLNFKVLKEKFDPCTPGQPGVSRPLEYNKCARGPTGGTHWGNYDVNYPAMFNSVSLPVRNCSYVTCLSVVLTCAVTADGKCECDYVSYKVRVQILFEQLKLTIQILSPNDHDIVLCSVPCGF